MANESTAKENTGKAIQSSVDKGKNGKPARERREYSHEMSDKERYALQVVLKAKAACAQLAIAIQEGKTVNPSAIKSCIDLQANAVDMLFG